MSLLTTMQKVADEVGLPRPVAIASSADQLSRQLFALANSVLEDLAELDWPSLTRAYSFDTVPGQEQYPMPGEYARFVTDTAFISSRYYQVRGSLTANEWARRRNEIPAALSRYRYRVFGEPCMLHIVPPPSSVENLTIEYISKFLVRGADDITKASFTEDTDTTLVPERLIRLGTKWRIKHAKGLDYSEDHNDYEKAKDVLLAQSLNLSSVPVAVRWPFEDPIMHEGYIPDTGYGV